MDESIVSIIVPCYKQAQYLSETLESVLLQTYDHWECIVVNDGSPDNVEEVALKYCDKDSRFKYVYKENGGLSSARNYGISKSKGKYILPLDSDDKISKWYIEKCLTILEANNNIKVCYSKEELFDSKRGVIDFPEYSLELLLCRNIIFCSGLFRRDDYNKTEGYRENMKFGFEDWDFWLQLLGSGGDVYKIDDVGFYYRIRKGSMAAVLCSPEKLRKMRRQIWENHKELYATHFVDPTECVEYQLIANSSEYRIGAKLLKLYRKFK